MSDDRVITQETPELPHPQPNEVEGEKAESKYAHIFADWDLLPPQVIVRRIRRIQE